MKARLYKAKQEGGATVRVFLSHDSSEFSLEISKVRGQLKLRWPILHIFLQTDKFCGIIRDIKTMKSELQL